MSPDDQLQIEVEGRVQAVAPTATPRELLAELAPEWLEHGVAVRVNGTVLDFQTPLRVATLAPSTAPLTLELVDPEGDHEHALEVCRHTCSHVLAQAVKQLYDDVQVGIGPPTSDGFYYDFLRDEPFTPEDLERIQARMRELVASDQSVERVEMTKDEALELFRDKGEQLKCELIRDKGGEVVSCYRQSEFIDFCTGPHLRSTGQIPALRLLSTAAAHWRGREDFPMVQRIYGTAFFSEAELESYLQSVEEAKARDHRRLGTDLDLFHVDETAGAGLVFWHPKGALVRHLVEDYLRQLHLERGYDLVYTPHIARAELWQQSGHYDYYLDNMYTLDVDEEEYVLKPMNCPGHIRIFQRGTRSYRDLPMRYAELGTVYRYERSGVLHGLLRVRGFTQDDAHIFCTPEQVDDEILGVLRLVREILDTFGFSAYDVELSVRDPGDPEKYAGTDEDWERAESALVEALDVEGLDYRRMEGEAVFYGPKIDVKVTDAIGRQWQCSTVQFDFTLPERFDITFVGDDGESHQVIMVHRAVLGSMERFFGTLVEHYGGAFPTWLAPVQAVVIPIADRHHDYAESVAASCRAAGLRVEVDARSEKMGAKIRDAQLQKIPFMLVVGDREADSGEVAVRHRTAGDLGARDLDSFIDPTLQDVEQRSVVDWPLR